MYLAIDIGATKTLIALFSGRGRVVRRRKFPTARSQREFVATLLTEVQRLRPRNVDAVVVAAPGVVQKNYTVRLGNRDWGDFDIVTPLKKLFSCPIWLENDANLAALYEADGLPGRTVFLTFSTGIGGGIVENGRLVRGVFEPGHEVYLYRGKAAEWEDIASASALEKAFGVKYATDLRKREQLREVAERVYLGLPDIARRKHPDQIILGGPLGKIFRLYVRYVPKLRGVTYRRPKRPNESVIYGAYLYAKQREKVR